jgi:hypothetical protein
MLRIGLRSTGVGSDVRGELVAQVNGDAVSITFDAVSHGDFLTNRTGLVVLHPPQTAGTALRVGHPDGSVTETAFPRAISAHQPVFDIAALAWEDDGLEIDVSFAGDVFEMEDQRNWSDASFKTYSRPLALPFPYPLHDGERVLQQIDVRVRRSDAAATDGANEARIALAEAGRFPRVGVAASTAPDPEPALPPLLGLELLVELDLSTPNWRAALVRAARRGRPLDVRVVLPVPDPTLLKAFARAIRDLPLARVAVFDPVFHVSEAALVEVLRAALRQAGVSVPVAGGSRSHFTELNRERARMPRDLDALVVTVTPLFHSLSTAQLEESVAMQRLIAEQTVEYAAGRPVHIGPVALRPRFNDVATGPQPAPTRGDLTEGYGAQFTGADDPRQGAPELAAWVIASAAALAVPGVETLTYFEEWGPRGIRSSDGAPYPAAEAVGALAELAGGSLLHGASPDGLVWAVGSRRGERTTVLAANLDSGSRRVQFSAPGKDAAGDVSVELAPRSWTSVSSSVATRG